LDCCICNDGTSALRVVNGKGYCKLHQYRAYTEQKKVCVQFDRARHRTETIKIKLEGKRTRRPLV